MGVWVKAGLHWHGGGVAAVAVAPGGAAPHVSPCLTTHQLPSFHPPTHHSQPQKVDPVVHNMLTEDPGKVDYSSIGGLGEQARNEIQEGAGGLGAARQPWPPALAPGLRPGQA